MGSREGFVEQEGAAIPCRGMEDRKGARTNSGKSVMRNLKAEVGKYGA